MKTIYLYKGIQIKRYNETMNVKSILVCTSIVIVFLFLPMLVSLFPVATVFAQGNQQYSYVSEWGSDGIGNGKFTQPLDIAIDSSGYLYVTDLSSVSNKIQKFDSNGTFITAWGNLGFGPGTFTSPAGIDVDKSHNNIYIADFGSPDTVYKYSQTMVLSLHRGVLPV